MSISSATTTREEFNTDGSTKTFSYTKPLNAATDLKAILRNTSTGVLTTLTYSTDYTVSKISGTFDNGATVTTTTTYASGSVLSLYRDISHSQTTSLSEGGAFPAGSVEDGLDKLTMLQHQIMGRLDRCIEVADGDVLPGTIGNFVDRADKYLKWDSSGVISAASATGTVTQTIGDNIYYTSDYGDMSSVITAIGAVNSTIYVDSNIDAAGDTIPANALLIFHRGGQFTGTGTVTINGPLIIADQQAFATTLTVSGLSEVDCIRPQWFGAAVDGSTDDTTPLLAALVASLASGKTLYLSAGHYYCPSWSVHDCTAGDLNIRGDGPDVTIITGKDHTRDFVDIRDIDVNVSGVHFTAFKYVLELREESAESSVSVQNCKNTDSLTFIFHTTVAGATVGRRYVNISNNIIDHGDVAAGTRTNGIVLDDVHEQVNISHNHFKDLNGTAIRVGSDVRSESQLHGPVIIDGNTIQGCIDPDGATAACNGIDVRVTHATITNNIIESISNDTEKDCEGIYTKINFGTIANNVLKDAGRFEAAIAIKGRPRNDGESATIAYGWAIQCYGNNISFPASEDITMGILIGCSDIECFGNRIDNPGSSGIEIEQNDSLDEDTRANISVHHNVISFCRGQHAIHSRANSNGLNIDDNVVYGMFGLGTDNTQALPVAITNSTALAGIYHLVHRDLTSGANVSISRNRVIVGIDSDGSGTVENTTHTGTLRGIEIECTYDLNGLIVDDNILDCSSSWGSSGGRRGVNFTTAAAQPYDDWWFRNNVLRGSFASDQFATSDMSVIPTKFHIEYESDDGKKVFGYNDGGTIRFKYLDLTGTGVTWVHTTTQP